jgi:hypothetical protein
MRILAAGTNSSTTESDSIIGEHDLVISDFSRVAGRVLVVKAISVVFQN